MAQDSAANTPGGESAAATPITNTQVRPGGAPARVYMNEKIVPYLLEGMKTVTKEQYVHTHLPYATLLYAFGGRS